MPKGGDCIAAKLFPPGRVLRVASGRAGFFAIPCAPRRLCDLIAVFSERTDTILPITLNRPASLIFKSLIDRSAAFPHA
jgi:hypothetical protein